MIKVEHVFYRYPTAAKTSLKDISVEIPDGQFLGVIGPNGAGKTTFALLLNGLVPQFFKGKFKGKVEVDGLDTNQSTIAELSLKVGVVFQNPFDQITGTALTVYDEVAYGAENLGLPREEIVSRVNEALQLVGIDHLGDRSPFELSGGQQQRVAIASMLVMKPQVLVLDEPTSQLDPAGSEEIFRAVTTLRQQRPDMTVIMVEHKMSKIAEYADRVLVMNDGQIVADGTPQEVFARPDFVETFHVNTPQFVTLGQKLIKAGLWQGAVPTTYQEAVNMAEVIVRDRR
jgi:energy-coupling factor transport system ATP-binding protein